MIIKPLHQWNKERLTLHSCYHGNVYQRSLPPAAEPPYHSYWQLKRGSTTVRYGGQQQTFRANDEVLLPPGLRQQQFSADITLLSLTFVARAADGVPLWHTCLPAKIGSTEMASGCAHSAEALNAIIDSQIGAHDFYFFCKSFSFEQFAVINAGFTAFFRSNFNRWFRRFEGFPPSSYRTCTLS